MFGRRRDKLNACAFFFSVISSLKKNIILK